MKLLYKRILIFFSVALDIGFLVMALFHTYDRTLSKQERRWEELMTIVRELNLPEARTNRVRQMMADFRQDVNGLEKAQREARMKTMEYLGQPGPLDRDRLHAMLLASEGFSEKKRDRFEAHVTGLRQVLGDEDGARFFTRLREHILAKRNARHP